jgi:TonB family protein
MLKMFPVLLSLVVLMPGYHALANYGQPEADLVIIDRATRDKTLNDYTHLTKSAIQKAWQTPTDIAVPGALKGKIAINYCIDRNGKLESVELVRGSGNPDMDRTLLEAIRSASPFPSFPDQLPAKRVLIRAKFIVAEVPTTAISTVQHSIQRGVNELPLLETLDPPKLNWGVSAGSPGTPEVRSDQVNPSVPAPPARKYKWGLP